MGSDTDLIVVYREKVAVRLNRVVSSPLPSTEHFRDCGFDLALCLPEPSPISLILAAVRSQSGSNTNDIPLKPY